MRQRESDRFNVKRYIQYERCSSLGVGYLYDSLLAQHRIVLYTALSFIGTATSS
jgi:hypothetical protein